MKPSFSPFGDLKAPLQLVHPKANVEMLGHLPCWLDPADPRPAREQLDAHYRKYGGWRPSPEGRWRVGEGGAFLEPLDYPSDPIRPLLATMKLRDEEVRFYHGAWTMIVQPDGSYEIARMD